MYDVGLQLIMKIQDLSSLRSLAKCYVLKVLLKVIPIHVNSLINSIP